MAQSGELPQHGLFKNYIARGPERLTVQENAGWNGGSFSVKDGQNNEVLQVVPSSASASQRRKIKDPAGNRVLYIRKSRVPFSNSFYGEVKKGKTTFKVTWKVYGTNASCRFTDSFSNKEEKFEMKGKFLSSSCTITRGGKGEDGVTVATISRQRLKVWDMVANAQTYTVTVFPGVDKALIVAMCICMDEKKEQQQQM